MLRELPGACTRRKQFADSSRITILPLTARGKSFHLGAEVEITEPLTDFWPEFPVLSPPKEVATLRGICPFLEDAVHFSEHCYEDVVNLIKQNN